MIFRWKFYVFWIELLVDTANKLDDELTIFYFFYFFYPHLHVVVTHRCSLLRSGFVLSGPCDCVCLVIALKRQ